MKFMLKQMTGHLRGHYHRHDGTLTPDRDSAGWWTGTQLRWGCNAHIARALRKGNYRLVYVYE